MIRPLISVVVPTRNRAPQLSDALRSIFAQEGAGDQFDLEAIVVDDASDDETPRVVEQYPGTRYIRMEKVQGESGSRNAGIEESRGTYVSFLDDDDTWLPHKLRTQLPVLLNDEETGLVYGQICQVKNGRTIGLFPEADRAPSGWIFPKMLMDPGVVSVISVLARRSMFDATGLFDTSLEVCPDSDLWLRLSFVSRFQFLPGPVAMRHISSEGQYLRGLREGKVERDTQRMLEKALLMLPPTGSGERQRREARSRLEIGLAGELGRIGELNRMRVRLRRGVEGDPDLLREPRIRQQVGQMAGYLARGLAVPSTAAMRSFAHEVLSLTQASVSRRVSRELLASIWGGTAAALGGNPKHRGLAGYSAALAMLYRPSKLKDRRLLKLIGSAMLHQPRDLLRAHWQGVAERSEASNT